MRKSNDRKLSEKQKKRNSNNRHRHPPPEPVKPPEPKVDFASMEAEFERRRKGAVGILKHDESQAAINLAMYGTNKTTTLGAGRNTKEIQKVDLNALQERYNFYMNFQGVNFLITTERVEKDSITCCLRVRNKGLAKIRQRWF